MPKMLPQISRYPLVFCALCLILFSACQDAPPPLDHEAEAAAIEAVLMAQQDAWNAGDIDLFMQWYLKSEALRFASGNSVRRGWDATLERYHTTYPDRAAMGTLAFSDLEINILNHQWATVFGRFYLTREASIGDLTGLYTLILEKRDGAWVIVSDHTSS